MFTIYPYENIRNRKPLDDGHSGATEVGEMDLYDVTTACVTTRHVAIKHADRSDPLQALKEMHLLMKLKQHDNIVQLLGGVLHTIDNVPHVYSLTEFVSGGSLMSRLHRRSGFYQNHPQILLRACLDIARALKHIHQHNIVHRDGLFFLGGSSIISLISFVPSQSPLVTF